ncbi:hypothetical protein HUJ04_009782 [Dendroctonus ponderosae]|nr:hypothetical protein HUJ04_009782 [Dendroctonus ponderosae]
MNSKSNGNCKSLGKDFQFEEHKIYKDPNFDINSLPWYKRHLYRVVGLLGLDIFLNLRYVNILIGLSLVVLVEMNFVVLLPFLLFEYSFTISEIAAFLSVLGAADIVFRFLPPHVGDCLKKPARVMIILVLGVIIAARLALIYISHYPTILIIALILGCSKGMRVVYMSLIIPSYVPEQHLASALVIQIVLNSLMSLLGGYAIGITRTTTGGCSTSAKGPKILIIGAGASGIAAAVKLFEHGICNITILEAENRIGGRVCSVEFGGTFVDIGGQWVHGEKGNVVYEMVKDLDLLSPSQLPQDPGMSFFLPDGTAPDKSLSDQLFALAIAVKDDQECARKHGGTFADYFTAGYNQRVQGKFRGNPSALDLTNLVAAWFQTFMVLLNPAECPTFCRVRLSGSGYQLSVTSHYVFQACEGDQMLGWRNRGYKTILDVLTKKIPDASKQLPIESRTILNKEAVQIDWGEAPVKVECSDGSTFKADHVILTASVGVLKASYKHLFRPALPDFKVRSWLENLFSFIAIDTHPNTLLVWINGPTAKLVELLPDETIIEGCMFMLRKFAGKQFEIPEPDGIIRGSYTYVSAEMERRQASAEDLAKPLTVNGKPVVLFAGEATHKSRFSTVNGAIETGHREAERIISLYGKTV